MTSENIIREWNFVQVKYPLTKIMNTTESLYLSYLLEQDKYFKKHEEYENGWFYLKRKNIEEKLNISKRTQIYIEERLEEYNYINRIKKPKQIKYKINYDQILFDVNNKGEKSAPSKGEKSAPSINKNILFNNNLNSSINRTIDGFPKENTKGLYHLTKHDFNTFIPILKKWNKYEHLSKMKLPQNESDECTKTVKDIVKYLNEIINGTFFDNNISNESYDRNKSYTVFDIEKSIKYLNTALSPGWFRDDKKNIPVSFKDYILTYQKRFSWFIYFMENPPEKLNESKIESKHTVKSSLIQSYINATGLFTEKDRQGIKNQLNRLEREYEEIEKNIGLVYSKWNTNWINRFSTFDLFCETHLLYLKTYSDLTVGHLSCGKKDGEFRPVWNKFIEFCHSEYGIVLYPKVKDLIKVKRWKYLGNSGLYKAEDFDNMYLKEDWKLIKEGRYLE